MNDINREVIKKWRVVEYNRSKDTLDVCSFGEMLDRNVAMAIKGLDSGLTPLALVPNPSEVRSVISHVRAIINAQRGQIVENLKPMRKLTIPHVEGEEKERD